MQKFIDPPSRKAAPSRNYSTVGNCDWSICDEDQFLRNTERALTDWD